MQSLRDQFLTYKVYAQKDLDAYSELYRTYYDRILRFAFYKVPTKEVAEDVAEEVFTRALEYLMERRIANFNAFAYQVTRNVIADFYRKNPQNVGIEYADQAHLPGFEKILEEADVQIEITRLKAHIDRLKPEHKEVVVLRYLDDLTVNEVADIIGRTPGHVRVIAHRAIKTLKNEFSKNYE